MSRTFWWELDMRVSREQAAKNRAHIIDTAARLFREKGYSGIGVADLMKEAGLTHGGFYGNFDSKEALAGAACGRAFENTLARWEAVLAADPETALAQIVRHYLSRRHVAHPGQGCAVAAMGSDLARMSDPVRTIATDGIRAEIALLAPLMEGATDIARRRAALAAYAGMVGALVVARAVNDDALGDEILDAVSARLTGGR
jgi:TetR/AcrR family transcriptional repressor of nem operon